MTETIQQLKEDIALLQMKLQKLEELQRTKSPVEIAYKDWWGEYPGTEIWTKDDEMRWVSFSAGYNASQEPKKEQKWDVVRESVKWCKEHPDESVEDYLKPHTPEKTEQLLREAFQKVQQTEEWKETQRKIDSNYDDMVKNPPEFLKFELGQSLEALITRWWCDVFTTHEDWDMETAIDDLCDRVELWLPKSQSSSGSQNVDTELLVDGYNDALTKIKSKLRNKKDT